MFSVKYILILDIWIFLFKNKTQIVIKNSICGLFKSNINALVHECVRFCV